MYSESDYDEEGWSEEEELYNKEKQKRLANNNNPQHHPYTINNNNNKPLSTGPLKVLSAKTQPKSTIEEDLRIAEGANALLNLAGIKTAHIVPLRSISPTSVCHNNNSLTKADSSDSGVTGMDTSLDSVKEEEEPNDLSDASEVKEDGHESDKTLVESGEGGGKAMEVGNKDGEGVDSSENSKGISPVLCPLQEITSIKVERPEEDMETS